MHPYTYAQADGGDHSLVAAYLVALRARLPPEASAAFTPAVAWRHYRLAFLDYARHLFTHMPTDASPAAIAARGAGPRAMNVGMVYRDPRVALRLVRRVDEYLSVYEAASG